MPARELDRESLLPRYSHVPSSQSHVHANGSWPPRTSTPSVRQTMVPYGHYVLCNESFASDLRYLILCQTFFLPATYLLQPQNNLLHNPPSDLRSPFHRSFHRFHNLSRTFCCCNSERKQGNVHNSHLRCRVPPPHLLLSMVWNWNHVYRSRRCRIFLFLC